MPWTFLGLLVVASLVVLALDMAGVLRSIGHKRAEALKRGTIGTLWLLIATALLAIVWVPIALAVYVIDIAVFQFILNREGWVGTNLLMTPYGWFVENVEWWLLGTESFNPLPYV